MVLASVILSLFRMILNSICFIKMILCQILFSLTILLILYKFCEKLNISVCISRSNAWLKIFGQEQDCHWCSADFFYFKLLSHFFCLLVDLNFKCCYANLQRSILSFIKQQVIHLLKILHNSFIFSITTVIYHQMFSKVIF